MEFIFTSLFPCHIYILFCQATRELKRNIWCMIQFQFAVDFIMNISLTHLRWIGPLRFICGSGTRRFHLRIFGPQMGSRVSPIVRMPQWWSRWWPPWDAPRHQKVALYILSLHVHALPLRVAPIPAVKYDLNGGLPTCIRFITYQEYMIIVYRFVFVILIWYLYLFWLNKHDITWMHDKQ